MKKQNIMLYALGGILIVSLIYFSITLGEGFGPASVITGEKTLYEGVSCEVPDDCYQEMINIGFPKTKLDEQLQNYDLICQSNTCGVEPK